MNNMPRKLPVSARGVKLGNVLSGKGPGVNLDG